MGFRLSRESEDDIVGIADEGLRVFGRGVAQKYHDELFAMFDLLAFNPFMARERNELTPPVRIHPFKAHLIVYIVETDGEILVVRVRHAHEDWSSGPV